MSPLVVTRVPHPRPPDLPGLIARRAAEILSEIVEDPAAVDDYREELVCLRPWLLTERFDRRALNRSLSRLSRKQRAA